MSEKLLFGSRKKTLFTRAVLLLLLTALPLSTLSGALSLSAFAGEITEEFSDDYSDRSGEGNGEEFSYEFQDESSGEVYTDSGNGGSGELPVHFEEETADEAAYGAADAGVEGSQLTGTAEYITGENAGLVSSLANYLVEKTKTSQYAGTFATRDGGFPWDSEGKSRSWTYYNGIMMDAFLMLDSDTYFPDVSNFYASNLNVDGTVNPKNKTGNTDNKYRENELDSIPPTRAVFDLLRLPAVKENETLCKKYKNLIKYVYGVMDQYPTIEAAAYNFKHKIPTDSNSNWNTYQFALDGLYMAQPFFMEVANALDSGILLPSDLGKTVDSAELSNMLYNAVSNRMLWVGDALYDESTQLYNHGWGTEAGLNGQYWLRAVGWYAAALADVISMLPDNYSDQKQALIANEKKLFDGMIQWQDPSTGMWFNVINYDSNLKNGTITNELESSGSALMAYAMMKSYAEGYVGDEYGEAGLRAFNGTVMNNLLVGSDGSYTLQNVYKSSGVETSSEGYLKSTYEDNEAKGVGPLIMASTWAEEAARIHNNPVKSEITGNEEVIALKHNDNPDFSGIELKLTFENPRDENGTERIIPSDQLTFGTFDPDVFYQQEVDISYNGKPYGSVMVLVEEPAPEFASHSLVLSGEIGVNFYVRIYGDINNYADSYMSFTCNGVETTVPLNTDFKNSDGTCYGFTCFVNSLQMAEEITAVFHYGENPNETIKDKYSVLSYLDTIQENSEVYGPILVSLANAINDYGYYAQQYLSRVHGFTLGADGQYTEVPGTYTQVIDSDFTEAAEKLLNYACRFEENENDSEAKLPISGLTYSLVLDARTEIRIYLSLEEDVTDSVHYTIFSSDASLIEENDLSSPESGDRYVISIKNISAHMLGDDYEVNIRIGDAESTLVISALSYASTVLNSDNQQEDTKAALWALYNYYKCAMSYRQSQ